MANFFDKIKQGVSDTGAKAKLAVDVQRLKQQINGKVKDMNGRYFEIGKLTYQAFKADDYSSFSSQLESLCNDISGLQREIDEIEENIRQLESQDAAAGGNPVAQPNAAPPQPEAAPAVNCSCGAIVPPGSKFCQECGSKM